MGADGDGTLAASDMSAIMEHTRSVYFLDDNEMAVLTSDNIELTDFDGVPIEKEITRITWNPIQAQKSGSWGGLIATLVLVPLAVFVISNTIIKHHEGTAASAAWNCPIIV